MVKLEVLRKTYADTYRIACDYIKKQNNGK